MRIAQIDRVIRAALDEDVGAGDLTTLAVVPAEATALARFVAREEGVIFGIETVRRVFQLLDPSLSFERVVDDGARVAAETSLAAVRGSARSILTGERTALNFLQRLSGIATHTASVVRMLLGTRIRLLDTRKTTPGLRALEKAAVRAGGGCNHRIGLFDAVMIKNNHLKFAPPAEAIRRARAGAPATACVEIEVESLEQLGDALTEAPDIVMLDNMSIDRMREAIRLIEGRARVEISGNVTEDRIPALTELGVDFISMGALTHSSRALDISLRVTVP